MKHYVFVNNSTWSAGELIAALQSFDPNTPVVMQDPDDDGCRWDIEHVDLQDGKIRII